MSEKMTLAQARESLHLLLPAALIKAVRSYNDLLGQNHTDAAKIKANSLALKSCASHIEQILKLAALAEKTEIPAEDLSALINAARAEIESKK
jgi:hypothetical protein